MVKVRDAVIKLTTILLISIYLIVFEYNLKHFKRRSLMKNKILSKFTNF